MKKPIKIAHIQQSMETSCAAAVLAMIYTHLGIHAQTESRIWKRLKKPREAVKGQYNIQNIDLAYDAEHHGLLYFWGRAVSDKNCLQPIRTFLKRGIPVIVFQKVSEKNTLGHARIVTGIRGNTLTIHDPLLNTVSTMHFEQFFKLWQPSKNREVIGGEFLAIFKKDMQPTDTFLVTHFQTPPSYFKISALQFKK